MLLAEVEIVSSGTGSTRCCWQPRHTGGTAGRPVGAADLIHALAVGPLRPGRSEHPRWSRGGGGPPPLGSLVAEMAFDQLISFILLS